MRFSFYLLVKQDITEEIKLSSVKKKWPHFLNTCLHGLEFKFCPLLQALFFPVAENLAAGSFSSQLHVFTIEGKKLLTPLTPIPASVGKASEIHLHSPSSQVPTPLTNHRARTVRCYDQPSLGHVRGDP